MPYTVESGVQPVAVRATAKIEYHVHAFAAVNGAPTRLNRNRTYSPERAVVHVKNGVPTRVEVTGLVVTDKNRPTRRRTTVVYQVERGTTPVLIAAGARWSVPNWIADLIADFDVAVAVAGPGE